MLRMYSASVVESWVVQIDRRRLLTKLGDVLVDDLAKCREFDPSGCLLLAAYVEQAADQCGGGGGEEQDSRQWILGFTRTSGHPKSRRCDERIEYCEHTLG